MLVIGPSKLTRTKPRSCNRYCHTPLSLNGRPLARERTPPSSLGSEHVDDVKCAKRRRIDSQYGR